jgi:hypothetical protein
MKLSHSTTQKLFLFIALSSLTHLVGCIHINQKVLTHIEIGSQSQVTLSSDSDPIKTDNYPISSLEKAPNGGGISMIAGFQKQMNDRFQWGVSGNFPLNLVATAGYLFPTNDDYYLQQGLFLLVGSVQGVSWVHTYNNFFKGLNWSSQVTWVQSKDALLVYGIDFPVRALEFETTRLEIPIYLSYEDDESPTETNKTSSQFFIGMRFYKRLTEKKYRVNNYYSDSSSNPAINTFKLLNQDKVGSAVEIGFKRNF